MDLVHMDHDFWEFVQYLQNYNFVGVPRNILRDMENPLEKYTNAELLQRYRFSRQIIQNILLPLIFNPQIPENERGLPVPSIFKLCVALRFYATGSYQRVCGDLLEISQSSTSRIIKEISERLAQNLGRFIKFPETEIEKQQNSTVFFEIAGFPGVIGCVDGTHIEIKNPGGPNAEMYRNRKGWMSLNVQVVAGPHYEILDIVIRWPGSAHDSRIFNSSAVAMRLQEGRLRGILLGDSAYQQSHYLFTPIQNPNTRAEERYNNAHIKTRNTVERTFGIWKSRFRCISTMLGYNIRTTTRIIAATAVLHNIAVQQREQQIDADMNPRNVPNPPPPVGENVRGNIIRAAFIQRHFMQ